MKMPSGRLFIVFITLISIMMLLFVSLTSIQVFNSNVYQKKADSRAISNDHIYAKRGKILDRKESVVADIAPERQGKEKGKWIWEHLRIYPHGHLGSQILGKVGRDGRGNAGLELNFDKDLRGRSGFERYVRSAGGREYYLLSEVKSLAIPGNDLVLTLDMQMQDIVENALKNGVEEFKAKSASAVIINPFNGDILAAATYPTFDPNEKKSNVKKCDIFSLAYEPGSTFKVVTAMAALQDNLVDPKSVWHGEKGVWVISKDIKIREHDSKDLGDMDMSMALAKSSNIVFAKIADSVGADNFYKFVRNFGFGSRSMEEIPGEESGQFKKPHQWSGRSLKTMGFGHEFLATPIQMAMVFGAIANGGYLMKPRIIKEWRDYDGNKIQETKPDTVRQMVSESVASQLREMLRGVVKGGTAKQVNSKILPGIEFSGKTGTAEKYSKEKKGFDRSKQVASFVGLAPSVNPQYVCMVLLDEPQTRTAGGVTAGPIFRRIMESIYMHPELSPKTYRLQNIENKLACNLNLQGKTLEDAEKLASVHSCHLEVSGAGEKIVSTLRMSSDSMKVFLGEDRVLSMPELKGLSLKDALNILGDSHIPVEFEGKGRIVEQYPAAHSTLERGQVCKLVLKENV